MVKKFCVNIAGLTEEVHTYRFEMNGDFFTKYGDQVVSEGTFTANITFDKHESFVEATFQIEGKARLTCDRSLELFDYPISLEKQMIYKFGNENLEVSEDVTIIERNTQELDLGQLIYEFIVLAIPMKKLHPKFKDQENDQIVYRSDKVPDEGARDPRWDVLKKLK
jgi:DUF177 domain-containing protein